MELETFKQTFLPLRSQLLFTAKNMLSNEDDAEDAVQEAYIKLWTNRLRLSDHPNMQGYAMQTLKNTCVDKIRSRKDEVSLDNVNIEHSRSNPYTELEMNNSMAVIKGMIETLPLVQRKIMQLRDIDGYELDEIAIITGSEVTAVRVNLSRARKKIREGLMEMYKKENIG